MLKEFESMINDQASYDYWYDEALFLCQDILEQLSDEEWDELSEKIGDYSENAQMRCVECLSDIESRDCLPMILRLIHTNSRELFVTCVDSLRCMDISSLSHSEKAYIMHRIKEYSEDASSPEKAVFKVVLDHLGY